MTQPEAVSTVAVPTSPDSKLVAPGDVGEIDNGGRLAIVYTTFPTLDAGQVMARHLVERRLAACVNLLPGMVAVYQWEGTIHQDNEVAAIVKTRMALISDVMTAIQNGHPYATPALVAIDVEAAGAEYLAWVLSSTKGAEAW